MDSRMMPLLLMAHQLREKRKEMDLSLGYVQLECYNVHLIQCMFSAYLYTSQE